MSSEKEGAEKVPAKIIKKVLKIIDEENGQSNISFSEEII